MCVVVVARHEVLAVVVSQSVETSINAVDVWFLTCTNATIGTTARASVTDTGGVDGTRIYLHMANTGTSSAFHRTQKLPLTGGRHLRSSLKPLKRGVLGQPTLPLAGTSAAQHLRLIPSMPVVRIRREQLPAHSNPDPEPVALGVSRLKGARLNEVGFRNTGPGSRGANRIMKTGVQSKISDAA
jgi:hypothetical protein